MSNSIEIQNSTINISPKSMTTQSSHLSDASICLHAGEEPQHKNTALTLPITQSSVFSLANLDEMRKIAEESARALDEHGRPRVAGLG